MADQTPIQTYRDAHDIGKEFYRLRYDVLGSNTRINTADNLNNFIVVTQTYDEAPGDIEKTQYYIQLGYFLKFIQDNIILNIDSDNNILKMLKIDYDVDTNLIATNPYMISSDPSICLFKADKFGTVFLSNGNDFFVKYNDVTYGKLMNVYFNMNYILDQINNQKDAETGKISLYNILNVCCKGFCEATGHFNNIEPTIDSDINTVRLIDTTSLPKKQDLIKTLSSTFPGKIGFYEENVLFDTYGYYYHTKPTASTAGFIKELSFNTTVSPKLATMITVGATKHGYAIGEDATALSRMNAGLTDRFKKNVVYPEQTPTTAETPPKTLEQQYTGTLIAYDNFIKDLGNLKWNADSVTDFKNTQTQLVEYYSATQAQSASLSQPTTEGSALPASANAGFLPFDLSLTMDGLSGMKVYQAFNITSDFLPSNYPTSLEFLIKGITHKIENNQWTTNIESMAIPKNPFSPSFDYETQVQAASKNPNERGYVSTTKGGTNRTIDGVKYKNGEIPENKLRVINNAAKYKGQISSDNGRIRLYEKASLALDRLILAAEQAGITVKINSAYRTYDDQVRVRAQYPNDSAKPGTSNHGFGLAVDFATPGLRRVKPGDKLYDWLIVNGPKYGFERIKKESWHWEYQI
jgi:hypothetical protein